MPNINTAYAWAVNTCNAANVGYSRTYRAQKVVNGITYYDCSSFIWYALKAGGFDVGTTVFATGTMGAVLEGIGFKKYTVTSAFTWNKADIGWRSGHTEMCYTAGVQGKAVFMGAHTSSAKLANQVSIGSSGGNATYANTSFTVCYRYEGENVYTVNPSAYVIAAICGNFWNESNINPGVWESLSPQSWDTLWHDNKGGYGLGQWTNTNGNTEGRLYQLHKYLSENGYADDSMEGQLAFIKFENVWHTSSSYQQTISYKSLTAFLQSDSTDLNELTKAWLYCWEGINNGTLSERQKHAQKCYDYIVAHANDSSITTYYHSNSYLTEEQILINAVMVYRLFGGVTGGGGGTSVPPSEQVRNGMPIWMMVRYF